MIGYLAVGDTDVGFRPTSEAEELTPTEVMEVATFHERQRDHAIAETKRFAEMFVKIHGQAFIDRLPDGVTIDAEGKAHVAGEEERSPLDTRLN